MTATIKSETTDQEVPETPKPTRSVSNLLLRLITGFGLIPLIIVLILWGGWPFMIAMGVVTGLATLEFYYMERRRGLQNNALIGISAAVAVLLAFQLRLVWLWQAALGLSLLITFALEFGRSRNLRRSLLRVTTTLGGILYIAFPIAFMLAIRQIQHVGIHWLFALAFATICTDTFAYLVGNMVGKTKLAPRLSPGKTVEGAAAGFIFGAMVPMIVLLRVQELSWTAALMLLLAPFAGIAGDLFESGLKRYFGVKDSHLPGFNIFPGHGGALDRFDALLWIATLFYGYLLLVGKLQPLI